MKSILVVEDEYGLSEAVKAVLEGEGYKVATCSTGEAALKAVRSAPPDLVLLDVMIPLRNGLTVMRLMADDPVLNSVPIILMTGASLQLTEKEQKYQGFLKKPFEMGGLLSEVRRTLKSGAV